MWLILQMQVVALKQAHTPAQVFQSCLDFFSLLVNKKNYSYFLVIE
ncbi:hypothetical protein Nmel_006974, partial [Mimus melanotis]